MFDQIWKICKFCTKNLPKPSHPCQRRDLQKNDFWFLNKSKEGFLWGLVFGFGDWYEADLSTSLRRD